MGRYNTVATTGSISTTGTLSSPTQGLLTTLTGTPPYTVTLTDPTLCTGLTQGFFNSSGGIVTLSTPTGVIKGPGPLSASAYALISNGLIQLTSDGTNYIVTGAVSSSFVNIDLSAATYTASAGQFIWCNTTSTAITVTLPVAPQKGDVIRFADVANTFNTNNLTIARNGQPIMSDVSGNLTVATQGAAFDLIYYDATRGWRLFTI